MSYITSYCRITNNTCFVNGSVVYAKQESSTEDWARQLYKNLGVDYPKFHKMDVLSKFALVGTELIKHYYKKINSFGDDEIALFFGNCNSCADVDNKFKSSYTLENNPSPSLFVYTLPNILIGEIAIRNKWYGENLFMLNEKFNAELFTTHCKILLSGSSKACLCGWVEITDENTDVFLFFAEQKSTDEELPLTSEKLIELYNK